MHRLNRYISIFLLVIWSITLQGCGSPKLEPIADDGVILAFGDSLTAGVGTSTEHSYPSVLAELSGLTVVNAGVSGETSDKGLKRLPGELDRILPDLLILIEGGNDILRNRRAADIRKHIEAMIKLANDRDIPVVLIGIPEKRLFSSSAPFYAELADQYQLVFDGSIIGDLQRSPGLKSDSIHFNAAGYRAMAESIYKLLRENGALQ